MANHRRVTAARCRSRSRNNRAASLHPALPGAAFRSVQGPSKTALRIRGSGRAAGKEDDDIGSPQKTQVGSQIVDLAPHCLQ